VSLQRPAPAVDGAARARSVVQRRALLTAPSTRPRLNEGLGRSCRL